MNDDKRKRRGSHDGTGIDRFVFLAVLAAGVALVLVGGLAPDSLVVMGAGVGAIYGAYTGRVGGPPAARDRDDDRDRPAG
ncbi:hypothetical protein [Embleya scabrispora]|jgi:hypothetical protein|uniref:hypothetical protein n=1 Tax=Embleya scabrispora TaxID=159449 RepID=UPI00036E2523|nr:hypothetical protein [Embleya scabrispora]MYS81572.1 hypothetical protein [Streptomyces sp. SID5474]